MTLVFGLRLVIVVPKTVELLQLLVDVGLSSSWTRSSTCPLLCTFLMSVEVPQVQFCEDVDVPVTMQRV